MLKMMQLRTPLAQVQAALVKTMASAILSPGAPRPLPGRARYHIQSSCVAVARPAACRRSLVGPSVPGSVARVPAPVEEQRLGFRAARAERGDPAGDQVVVAGLVHRLDGAALHPGQRRRPGPGRPTARATTAPRRTCLRSRWCRRPPWPPPAGPSASTVAQEAPGPLDHRPGGRAAAGAEQHQRRCQRQRGKRLAGEPGQDLQGVQTS